MTGNYGHKPASGDLSEEIVPRFRLTPRERQIVQLLAEGKANKEVAHALEISLDTVETHRKNILNKLHLRSTARSGPVRHPQQPDPALSSGADDQDSIVRVQEPPLGFGTTETFFIPARKQSCTSAPMPSIGTNRNTCRIGI